jgi:tRNA(Ile)-lysidine synthase
MPIRDPSEKYCSLEIQARKTIREHNMVVTGENVVVGVSGGADSTALLLCLSRLSEDMDITLTVAHLNHRIRGAEADADEEFVRQMTEEIGLPFVSEVIDVKRQAAAKKQNIEELARRIRYDFLRRTARSVEAQKIAIGHNLNDQAETALFRFIRGSGLEGLSAIHPVVDGLIIRPLLECSRASIFEYLKQKNASYQEDSSNRDLRHSRNRIRQELMPYLESNFNPRLVATISNEAFLAREAWSFMESQAKEAYTRLHCQIENGISIKIKDFRDLHPALQKEVLRQALKACLGSLRGIGSVHIQSILALCSAERSGQAQIPRGSLAIRESGNLLLLRNAPQPTPSFVYELSVPGKRHIPEDGAVFNCTLGDAPNRDAMKDKRFTQAFLDPSVLPESLTIRSRMPGDCYGGPGHRKVKRMLINSKIPRPQRSVLPMVTVGNDVIWIPGFRPARGYEAKPESANCVVVEMVQESD